MAGRVAEQLVTGEERGGEAAAIKAIAPKQLPLLRCGGHSSWGPGGAGTKLVQIASHFNENHVRGFLKVGSRGAARGGGEGKSRFRKRRFFQPPYRSPSPRFRTRSAGNRYRRLNCRFLIKRWWLVVPMLWASRSTASSRAGQSYQGNWLKWPAQMLRKLPSMSSDWESYTNKAMRIGLNEIASDQVAGFIGNSS